MGMGLQATSLLAGAVSLYSVDSAKIRISLNLSFAMERL